MESIYIKHKIVNLININKIISYHYYEFDKDFDFSGESHNFWEMVYVDSGNVKIKANKKEMLLNQGDVIFHKPNEFHTLSADNKAPSNVFVITFDCSSEPMKFFKEKVMSVPGKLKKYISMMVEELCETFYPMAYTDVKLNLKDSPPIGSQQMIKTYLEQFLILLMRQGRSEKDLRIFPSKESLENHLVSEMINFIDSNIFSELSVSRLCKEMNCSRSYISKIFKQETDYTVLEYILIQKIKTAKKLIKEKNMNFTEISDKLAFDNPHYFSRVFKRVTNMTPTDYKNSVK